VLELILSIKKQFRLPENTNNKLKNNKIKHLKNRENFWTKIYFSTNYYQYRVEETGRESY
jgi:hypothetical protein